VDAITELLSTYAAELSHDDLTADAVRGMKRRLVDSMACAIGGRDGEPVAIARELARGTISTPPERILFSGEETTPELAAFANGVMVRYLDFNDSYFSLAGGHPSDTIAATLAMADALRLSGRDALRAMVTAYEVFCALGEVDRLTTRGIDHSLHVAVGSAVGAGKAMGLDAERMAHAISIALVSNVSLKVSHDGQLSMWKGGSAANAARNGVFAARLAGSAMPGPGEQFAADGGLTGVLGETPDLPVMGGRGQPFHTDRTSMKHFPAQDTAQAAIWAAAELRGRLGRVVPSSVLIHTYRRAVGSGAGPEKWRVTDRETADHSIPYLVAAMLLDGKVGPAEFTDARIADPALHELMARIEVREEPAMTARFPGAHAARIEAVADGVTHVVDVDNAKGHAANPLSNGEIEAKFRRLADGVLPAAACDRALARLWAFDDEPDVSEWVRSLMLAESP
jgi:2-methylcitrate dehydratase